MFNNYVISIIVPVYNTEKYLEKCISSICNQSYSNLDIILINDGSTDKSPKICDKFAQIDKRIRVVHTSNKGQASARNTGLELAKGEYIGFVDSDDFIEENMYELMLKSLLTEEADIVQIGISNIDEAGNIIRILKKKYEAYFEFQEKMKAYVIEKKIVASICDKLFHKSLWEDIRMQDGYYYEDGMVLLDLLKESKKIILLEELGYYYVQSKYSTQRGPYTIKHLESCIYEPNYYYDFFSEYAQEFKEYALWLKCYRSMRGYRLLKDIKSENRKKYKQKFIKTFNDNYKEFKKTRYYKNILVTNKCAMCIFRIMPNVYLWLYGILR